MTPSARYRPHPGFGSPKQRMLRMTCSSPVHECLSDEAYIYRIDWGGNSPGRSFSTKALSVDPYLTQKARKLLPCLTLLCIHTSNHLPIHLPINIQVLVQDKPRVPCRTAHARSGRGLASSRPSRLISHLTNSQVSPPSFRVGTFD